MAHAGGGWRLRDCVIGFTSLVACGATLAEKPPCVEATNRIWSTSDATSFEAIESQIHVLKVKSGMDKPDAIKSFPDLGDC